MSNDTPLSVRAATKLVDKLPSGVENTIAPLYYRYNSRKADREHSSPKYDSTQKEGAPDHVLLIVIDALRPDSAPDVDLEFGHAITPATWTYPAMTSIHTSLYPHEHGSFAHADPDGGNFKMPIQYDSLETLPHVMESAGYSTYSGCSFIVPFLATRGWYKANRVYDDTRAEGIINKYLQWRKTRQKTFGYLHLGDLHNPLTPPQEYIDKHELDESLDLQFPDQWADSYDGSPEAKKFREERLKLYSVALEYVSDQISQLLEQISDDTIVVITGDHGESQFEHSELDHQFSDSRPNYCVGHGGTPYDELARVPVAVSVEGEQVTPSGGWGSLIDIPRTISEQTLNAHPFSGLDWAEPIPKDRAVICEASRYGTERKAVYNEDRILIHSRSDDVTLTAWIDSQGVTFDDSIDPEELLAELPDQWDDFEVDTGSGEFAKSQLEALGYV